MSYSRRYHAQAYYSGSVSYPASQSGGSVSYSGSVPIDITIHVDTDPFDRSVNGCNSSVNGLTAAVVATEAAEVASKRAASKKIANTIIKGFFDYVGSDLSQKIRELLSTLEARVVEMMSQKKDCNSKQTQMQEDFIRITGRYAKIFEDLDHECDLRVKSLDKPCFQFISSTMDICQNHSGNMQLGLAAVAASENLCLESVLASSHVKKDAVELIDKSRSYLTGVYRLSSSIRDMLADVPEAGDVYLPVMMVETTGAQGGTSSKLYGVPDSGCGDKTSVIASRFQDDSLSWGDIDSEDQDLILAHVNSYIGHSDLDDRTVKTMMELIEKQSIQTIKK